MVVQTVKSRNIGYFLSKIMEFTLDNMCRTCLNEDGLMYSVFSKENQIQRNQSYADMLMACASVQVIIHMFHS